MVDNRFHCLSPPPSGLSVNQTDVRRPVADKGTQLIKALGLAPVHIAGSSAGANIGLVLARDYPDLLRTLILGEPDLSPWLLEISPAEDMAYIHSGHYCNHIVAHFTFPFP